MFHCNPFRFCKVCMLQLCLKAGTGIVPPCLILRAFFVLNLVCGVNLPRLEPYDDSSHHVLPSGKRDNTHCDRVPSFREPVSFHNLTLRDPNQVSHRSNASGLMVEECLAQATVTTLSMIPGRALPTSCYNNRACRDTRPSGFIVQLHRLHVVRRSQWSQDIAKTAAYSIMYSYLFTEEGATAASIAEGR